MPAGLSPQAQHSQLPTRRLEQPSRQNSRPRRPQIVFFQSISWQLHLTKTTTPALLRLLLVLLMKT